MLLTSIEKRLSKNSSDKIIFKESANCYDDIWNKAVYIE